MYPPFLLWERWQSASSAPHCVTLGVGQHLQSPSHPLQCVQLQVFCFDFCSNEVLQSLLRKPGILQKFFVFFFFFACGCHLKSVTSAVESGQDQFTDSCWFHSLHQGCLLCDRWVRLLSGPLALGARFHNAHRDTLSMDRCQTLVDVTLRGHLA